MDKFASIAQTLAAPRVNVVYVDAEGRESSRDIVVTEVKDNLIIGLDTSSSDANKRWHVRSFRTDRIKSLTVVK